MAQINGQQSVLIGGLSSNDIRLAKVAEADAAGDAQIFLLFAGTSLLKNLTAGKAVANAPKGSTATAPSVATNTGTTGGTGAASVVASADDVGVASVAKATGSNGSTGSAAKGDAVEVSSASTVSASAETPVGVNGGVAAVGSVADANFAQSTIRASEVFSKDGIANYSQLAGRPINTVDDLVAALQSGAIKPSQLPVDYVVGADGTKLILNTRTSVALDRAGVPKSDWYGTNKTGVPVPDMPGKTFNDLADDQLKNNKLPSTGTPTMPKGKK